MRSLVLVLVIVFAAVATGACARRAPADQAALLQTAADRTVNAQSYEVSVFENDRLVETMTVDKEAGYSARLEDGAEARQVNGTIYFRKAGASEWLTAAAPMAGSIVDFGVAGLRAAQGATDVHRSSDSFVFNSGGMHATVSIERGYVGSVIERFSSPLKLTRTFRYSSFGRELAVDVPPADKTRPAALSDCESRRGGPESVLCASVFSTNPEGLTTTTAR